MASPNSPKKKPNQAPNEALDSTAMPEETVPVPCFTEKSGDMRAVGDPAIAQGVDDTASAAGTQVLSDKEEEVLQLFRFGADSEDKNHEFYKGRVEDKAEGTCQWFLNHELFRQWLDQDAGPLLIAGDAGCGKSVLTKYLIDYELPRSATVCHFFFQDQDRNTARQALCQPSLIQLALPAFYKKGSDLINTADSLLNILWKTATDPEAGSVILALDGLDRCAKVKPTSHDFISMLSLLCQVCSPGYSKAKVLITSRPSELYEHVNPAFQVLVDRYSCIRMPGGELDTTSDEMNLIVRHRASRSTEERQLPGNMRNCLEQQLMGGPHRSYLWLHLVLDYLKTQGLKRDINCIESLKLLPRNVEEAYEMNLNKTKDSRMAGKAFCILSAAIDLDEEATFASLLRSWCGPLISIYHGKVYLFHQSVRQFLLTYSSTREGTLPASAHTVLAEACVTYLSLFNSNRNNEQGKVCLGFLAYSSQNWGTHFREAQISDGAAILPPALSIYDPASESFSAWFRFFQRNPDVKGHDNFTELLISAYYGHAVIAKLLLERGAEVDTSDSLGWTPLSWAARNGHEAVVKLLLASGADVNRKEAHGVTPLSHATRNGHEGTVKLLLDGGADIALTDEDSRSPLWWAAEKIFTSVLQLMIDHGDFMPVAKGVEHSKAVLQCCGFIPYNFSQRGGFEIYSPTYIRICTEAWGWIHIRKNGRRSVCRRD
ncbi:hypothetical protein AJ79_08776 [Helicocarpus griseus UAMH5409]|uniref:Uncharacterized protein n=1 Tax=Helicocarpus griseus UAMH5409 TaxID=1447875 RepID=A0A2B7WQC6_9EURO|nr:hypothetical protein AJ79_08776 [Helicocarpus griseus UAMH5409]